MRVEDLASATRLASRTITRIEAGHNAQLFTFERIAQALDISVSDLLDTATEIAS